MMTKKLQLLKNIFPENPKSGQVLSVDSEGNKKWNYPLVMDVTLTEGYQAVINKSGVPQELFVIDISNPLLGTFILKEDYFTYVRIKNGDTILVSAYSLGGIMDKLEVHSVSNEGVLFSVYCTNGFSQRFYYSVTNNIWNLVQTGYRGEYLADVFSEKISFNNTTEYTPSEDYNPATKKYVDDSVANIPEQVNADWNQNDASAPSYIENRTHYTELKIIMEQTELDGFVSEEGAEGFMMCSLPHALDISAGEEIDVVWDGETYNITAASVDDSDIVLAGNAVLTGGEDSGEPFSIALSPSNSLTIFFAYDSKTSHSIKIEGLQVIQLPEKFIPDSIARGFNVNIGTGVDGELVADKTYDEILAAFTAGHNVTCTFHDGSELTQYKVSTTYLGNEIIEFVNVQSGGYQTSGCTVEVVHTTYGRIWLNSDNNVSFSTLDGSLLPTPFPDDTNKFLCGDGTWSEPIPGLTTATVGQTIVVKSIDENGKPIEWEAVDPFVLTDENTSIKYKLSVVDGILTMTEVTS